MECIEVLHGSASRTCCFLATRGKNPSRRSAPARISIYDWTSPKSTNLRCGTEFPENEPAGIIADCPFRRELWLSWNFHVTAQNGQARNSMRLEQRS